MPVATPWIGRRDVLIGMSAAASSLVLPAGAAWAQGKPVITPAQTEGPFYPVEWKGDIDNDLVAVTGEASKALGQVVHLDGRVLDLGGNPLPGALVEIWQCDAHGVYRHPQDARGGRHRDAAFQGRGRTRTDVAGRYSFRTIKPVPYPGRTPHIHFRVEPAGHHRLITQMYVFGEPLNQRDGVLNNIRDRRQRDSVIVRLEAANGIEPNALAGTFNIVIG